MSEVLARAIRACRWNVVRRRSSRLSAGAFVAQPAQFDHRAHIGEAVAIARLRAARRSGCRRRYGWPCRSRRRSGRCSRGGSRDGCWRDRRWRSRSGWRGWSARTGRGCGRRCSPPRACRGACRQLLGDVIGRGRACPGRPAPRTRPARMPGPLLARGGQRPPRPRRRVSPRVFVMMMPRHAPGYRHSRARSAISRAGSWRCRAWDRAACSAATLGASQRADIAVVGVLAGRNPDDSLRPGRRPWPRRSR